jgi:hypothetical protein
MSLPRDNNLDESDEELEIFTRDSISSESSESSESPVENVPVRYPNNHTESKISPVKIDGAASFREAEIAAFGEASDLPVGNKNATITTSPNINKESIPESVFGITYKPYKVTNTQNFSNLNIEDEFEFEKELTLDVNIDQKNGVKEDEEDEEDDEFSLELDNTNTSYSTENLLQNAINNYR